MSPHQFELLLAPLVDSAYRIALCLADGSEDAEAMLREAAIRAFHRFDQRGPEGEFRWWFLRIMAETFRARQRRTEPPATARSPGSMSDDDRVLAAIRHLSPCRRMVAALYFAEGLSCRDVACVLRCSHAAVRRRIRPIRSAFGAWTFADGTGTSPLTRPLPRVSLTAGL